MIIHSISCHVDNENTVTLFVNDYIAQHVGLCQAVSDKTRTSQFLCVSLYSLLSSSSRENSECSGKCSATNVSKVSAVLLVM